MAYDFPAGLVLSQVGHRPWPRPAKPWVMRQTWHHLLFAHWAVDAQRLRALLPAGLELEFFDNKAWLSIVSFDMSNVGPRWFPPLPGLSSFPELNVRTYVTYHGKPGLYFFSLDSGSNVAVWLARTLFQLPSFGAAMEVKAESEWIRYRSVRKGSDGQSAEFQARYRPMGTPSPASRGSIEAFLCERYCLYNLGRGRHLWRMQLQHPPWQLQPVEARIGVNTLTSWLGVPLPATPPLLHYARRQDMVAYLPERA